MPALSDIEQLRYLGPIGRRFAVRFRLHGGVAFRCALGPIGTKLLDLFDLAPFTADINLVHSGSADTTPALFAAILSEVPDAEYFRWELRSEGEQKILDELFLRGGCVPSRALSLTDDPSAPVLDPTGGYDDIQSGRYRYYCSPYLKTSHLYREGRDLPVFSALLYLQTLFEAPLDQNARYKQPGWAEAAAVFATSGDFETRRLLEEHAHLRHRLRCLVTNAFAAAAARREFLDFAHAIGLVGFVDHIASALRQSDADQLRRLTRETVEDPAVVGAGEDSAVVAPSLRLLGDTARVPLISEGWRPGGDEHLERQLAQGQTVLVTSPDIVLAPGLASSVRISDVPMEFLHFHLPSPLVRDQVANFPDIRYLSAIVQLNTTAEPAGPPWELHALPCAVNGHQDAFGKWSSLQLRINCFGFLEEIARSEPALLRISLVGLSQ